MGRRSITPTDIESPFTIDELFFSTTDKKGIITSGNKVFSRVANYSIEDLLGTPHNVIRHPDMPKAVFKLLWDTISAGKPIVAYVKNLSKTGTYYWVVAVVQPFEDRYLSVRFKPSSPLFKAIPDVYRKMLEVEKMQGMNGSTQVLVETLNSLGFTSYEAFMAHLLTEELKSRDAHLAKANKDGKARRTPKPHLRASDPRKQFYDLIELMFTSSKAAESEFNHLCSKIGEFLALKDMLSEKSEFILTLAKRTRFLSLNASMEAQRLGSDGKTLAVVSEMMEENATHTASSIELAETQIVKTVEQLKTMTFQMLISKLETEMISFFTRELMHEVSIMSEEELVKSARSIGSDLRILAEVLQRSSHDLLIIVRSIFAELTTLHSVVTGIAESIDTVEFIHKTGTIETARTEKLRAFGKIFRQASNLVKSSRAKLEDFLKAIESLKKEANDIREADHNISNSLKQIGDALIEFRGLTEDTLAAPKKAVG